VFVTGSNAKFLSKDVITEFRGRGWEIRVHALSFAEYYAGVGGEKQEALENVIYNELRRLGYSVDIGLVETFGRG